MKKMPLIEKKLGHLRRGDCHMITVTVPASKYRKLNVNKLNLTCTCTIMYLYMYVHIGCTRYMNYLCVMIYSEGRQAFARM